MKKIKKKLVLAKETIRELGVELTAVVGGEWEGHTKTKYWSVVCESGSC